MTTSRTTSTTDVDDVDDGTQADALGIWDSHLVARRVARAAGLAIPDGRAAVALAPRGSLTVRAQRPDTESAVGPVGTVGIDDAIVVSGVLRAVAGAQGCESLLVLTESPTGPVAFCAPSDVGIIPAGWDLAGDPRSTLVFDRSVIEHPTPISPELIPDIPLALAAVHAAAIEGAARRCAELTVEHTATRRQFGRTLDHFQAVKQNQALLLEEVALVSAAVGIATSALREFGIAPWTEGDRTAVTAAVVQAGASVGDVARLAHQLHGAVGFTELSKLHRHTTSLWAWREAITDEWAWRLGETAIDADGSGMWDLVTRTTTANRQEEKGDE